MYKEITRLWYFVGLLLGSFYIWRRLEVIHNQIMNENHELACPWIGIMCCVTYSQNKESTPNIMNFVTLWVNGLE